MSQKITKEMLKGLPVKDAILSLIGTMYMVFAFLAAASQFAYYQQTGEMVDFTMAFICLMFGMVASGLAYISGKYFLDEVSRKLGGRNG